MSVRESNGPRDDAGLVGARFLSLIGEVVLDEMRRSRAGRRFGHGCPGVERELLFDDLPLEEESIVATNEETEICISEPAFDEMRRTLCELPVESGGLLFGPRNHEVITHFVLDREARRTSITFPIDKLR